jgi:hypothetical protein
MYLYSPFSSLLLKFHIRIAAIKKTFSSERDEKVTRGTTLIGKVRLCPLFIRNVNEPPMPTPFDSELRGDFPSCFKFRAFTVSRIAENERQKDASPSK